MESVAIEKVDTNAITREAEAAVEKADIEALGQLLSELIQRQKKYEELARQSDAEAVKAQKELENIKKSMAYSSPEEARDRYNDSIFSSDFHLARVQASLKESANLKGIIPELRKRLESIQAKAKAADLGAEAVKLKKKMETAKARFLPALKEVVERAAILGREAREFNHTIQTGKIPQESFLRCDLDVSKLLAALEGLDVYLAPELENLVSPSPNGFQRVVLRINRDAVLAGNEITLPTQEAEDLINVGFARPL